MPVIAVEGLDGSGKTTIARLLSKRIGCGFVEKPMRWLLQRGDEAGLGRYDEVVNRVNALESAVARQWFYCLGWLLIAGRHHDSLVVVDRYVLSSLSYNYSESFDDICALALNFASPPLFTVLLAVSEGERLRRLGQRSADESEFADLGQDVSRFARMQAYLDRQNWPHIVVTTDSADPAQVVDAIMQSIAQVLGSLPPEHK